MQLQAKRKCVQCFKLLSVKSRFNIFRYLSQPRQQVSVSALAKLTKLRQPTVTFHLNELAAVGLVQRQRVGRNVFCRATRKCRDCPLFAT